MKRGAVLTIGGQDRARLTLGYKLSRLRYDAWEAEQLSLAAFSHPAICQRSVSYLNTLERKLSKVFQTGPGFQAFSCIHIP